MLGGKKLNGRNSHRTGSGSDWVKDLMCVLIGLNPGGNESVSIFDPLNWRAGPVATAPGSVPILCL
jgi:hypothetical protein